MRRKKRRRQGMEKGKKGSGGRRSGWKRSYSHVRCRKEKGKERMRAEGTNTRKEERQDGRNKGQEKREKRERWRGGEQPRKGNRGGRRRVRSQAGDRGDGGERARRGRGRRREGEGILECNSRTRARSGG